MSPSFGWMMRRFPISHRAGVQVRCVIEVEVDTWLGHVGPQTFTRAYCWQLAHRRWPHSGGWFVIQGIGLRYTRGVKVDPASGDILTAGSRLRIPRIADRPTSTCTFDKAGFDHVSRQFALARGRRPCRLSPAYRERHPQFDRPCGLTSFRCGRPGLSPF